MRVFMTGATGFVGRALTLRLLGGGHQVSAWVRSQERARSTLGSGVRFVSAAGGARALAQEAARADAVVNLAGEPVLGGRWTAQRRQAMRESRIDLTRSIVAALSQSSPRPSVMISASAIGYYGDRGDELLDEASAPGADFLARLCVEWEAAAMQAEQAGVRVFIPRIGIVLGIDGGALARMMTPFAFGAGGPIGSGRQWMGWIHLLDLVEVIVAALEDQRYRGAAIAAAPSPVTSREFARQLGRVMHRPAFLPVPVFALRALYGEGASVLSAGQRVLPARLTELGFNWRFARIEPALHHLLAEDGPEIEAFGPSSPPPRKVSGSTYLDTRRASCLLRQTTRVNAPITEVFSFFSRPENLGVMTPADLHFQIIGAPPAQMCRGARIEYRLRAGVLPLRWRTVIEEWQPHQLMIDSQERGPYRCWWHEHHFRADGDWTVMEDRVYFAPPLGVLGAGAAYLFVKPALRRIFRFRTEAIGLRFRGAAEAGAGNGHIS